jgi:7-cyano-7-deazaguanine synthase in queuosine biosynthesis
MEINVILFSGGKESLFTLDYFAKNSELPTELLFFDYGQKAVDLEYSALRYYSKLYNIPFHIIKSPIFFNIDDKEANPDIPYRNSLLSLLALNYYAVNYPEKLLTVFLGVSLYYDYSGNDGSHLFLHPINSLIQYYRNSAEIDSVVKLYRPADIDEYVSQLDCSHLVICMYGVEKVCGKCYKCKNTEKDFPNIYNKLK